MGIASTIDESTQNLHLYATLENERLPV